jgi:glucosamine kinase
MLLIADSGGTKTDWRVIIDKKNIISVKTPGINPYYQNSAQILSDIKNNLPLDVYNQPVSMVFFYGAGCSNKEKQELVYSALKEVFLNAEIIVNSDVLGAARALCNHNQGIVCVIGTGSGSCIYDGHKITASIPSLGYILGDEGSGAYLGKRLLQDYLRGDMPQSIISKLRAQFEINKELVLENVNRRPMPGRYLGSFSQFLHSNIKSEYVQKLVSESFTEFILNYIVRYPDYHTYNTYFIGSVAFYFSEILRNVLESYKIQVKRIVESPMEDLINFHFESL